MIKAPRHLRVMRWVVALATVAGIASSVVMNVIHAPNHGPARFVAGLPPIAVWACIEFITRIPSSAAGLTRLRIGGASVVTTGAVVLSYWQQFKAVESLGFPTWQAAIWPIIIDGTMVVTSVSLLEVVRKIRQIEGGDQATAPAVAAVITARDLDRERAALAYRAAAATMGQAQAGSLVVNGSKAA